MAGCLLVLGLAALWAAGVFRIKNQEGVLVIEVNEPEQASEAIARAFHIAESGTPGPVAVPRAAGDPTLGLDRPPADRRARSTACPRRDSPCRRQRVRR